MGRFTSELYLGQDDTPKGHASPEAELPRCEDEAEIGQSYCAGGTPTRTGNWAGPLLVRAESDNEASTES